MDDEMLELTAGNQTLRRRLDAYAEARLSPDPAATGRIRARVMAAAHRQAAITAAGTGLTVLGSDPAPRRRPVHRHPLTRLAGVILSAALGLTVAIGAALASDAGGPLYGARLGLEVVMLPGDPALRAVAELDRLESRLAEAAAASARGDAIAMATAMGAYAAILDDASAAAIAADDPVASAALEAGVARNMDVLRALLDRAPAPAIGGLTQALERSDAALREIGAGPTDGGEPGSVPIEPGTTMKPDKSVKPTKAPIAQPTAEPTTRITQKPVGTAMPEPTDRPDRTPRSERTPPAHGTSDAP